MPRLCCSFLLLSNSNFVLLVGLLGTWRATYNRDDGKKASVFSKQGRWEGFLNPMEKQVKKLKKDTPGILREKTWNRDEPRQGLMSKREGGTPQSWTGERDGWGTTEEMGWKCSPDSFCSSFSKMWSPSEQKRDKAWVTENTCHN